MVDREDSAGKKPRGARVVCVPAADKADEVVAKLLAAALLEGGVGAAFVKPEELEQIPLSSGGEIGRTAVEVVVVSALPPEAVPPARAICRTVRNRTPDLPLIVGLWDPGSDLAKPRQRLEVAGAGHLVVTFAECLSTLDAMAAAANPDSAAHPGASPAEPSMAPATPSTRRNALLHS